MISYLSIYGTVQGTIPQISTHDSHDNNYDTNWIFVYFDLIVHIKIKFKNIILKHIIKVDAYLSDNMT